MVEPIILIPATLGAICLGLGCKLLYWRFAYPDDREAPSYTFTGTLNFIVGIGLLIITFRLAGVPLW